MQRIKKKNKNCRHCSESQWGHFQGQTSQTQKNIQFTVIEDSENCYRIFFSPFFFAFFFIILASVAAGSVMFLGWPSYHPCGHKVSRVRWWEFLQIWSKCLLGVNDDLMRFWRPRFTSQGHCDLPKKITKHWSFYVIYCHLDVLTISGWKPVPMLEVSLVVYTPQHLNKSSLYYRNQPRLCHITKKVFFSKPW